jgi:hypothetical protein
MLLDTFSKHLHTTCLHLLYITHFINSADRVLTCTCELSVKSDSQSWDHVRAELVMKDPVKCSRNVMKVSANWMSRK